MAYLIASYLVWTIVLLRVIFVPPSKSADFLSGFVLAFLITMVCVYDAAAVGQPWAFGERLPFLILWPVAVPIYVVRSRGWWGCVLLMIHGSVLFSVSFAVAITAVLVRFLGK
jgi:hypothetical protein